MTTSDALLGSNESVRAPWGAGVAAGTVGGVGMGLGLHFGANVMTFVGALYAWLTVIGGWIVHLVNSVLIALLSTAVVSRPAVAERVDALWTYVVCGVLYASAVGLVTAGVMLPVAMNPRGARTVPDPGVPLSDLLGTALIVLSVSVAHVVYGVLLGATYGAVHADRASEPLASVAP